MLNNRALRSPNHRRSGDEGSAYMISLLVLLVLTVLGMSLLLITQTGVLAGGQERVIERTFYAAGSGVELSIARALANGDFGPAVHERQRSGLEAGQLMPITERVESSTFFCLGDTYCDLCSVNQGRQYSRRNHMLAVSASRLGISPDATETVLGRKALSTMVDVEPFQATVDCLANMPEATAGYRFDDF